MKELDANNLCSHDGDTLAYLYDEMTAGERERFECHLADCTTCIDDFAELSQSRYPVFEWKQLEFDPLPTPRVVIPFAAASVSWLDKLRASFALRPAFAFGSLATIGVVVSLAAFALLGGSRGHTELAGASTPEPIDPSPEATIQVQDRVIQPVTATNQPRSVDIQRDEAPKLVKASTSAAKPEERSPRPKATQQAKRNEPLPALNSADEDEDDSLRLADIFEEIGTSES